MIALCPLRCLDLEHWASLAQWSRTRGSLADVELASSISLPLTMALNYKVHSLLLDLEIEIHVNLSFLVYRFPVYR